MPLPSGVTYVTVLSVDAYDEETKKPTMCSCKFDVSGIEYTAVFNIGMGFLAQLNAEAVRIKKAAVAMVSAQNIVNNKVA